MDRKLPSIALIALLLTLFLPSLGYGYWKGEEDVEPLDHYYIEVFLDEREYKLSGYLVLHHFNKHSVAFRELYFHVYPNAFKPWNGSVEILSVINLNTLRKLKYSIVGEDLTILKVFLDEILEPKKWIKIAINFTVLIARKGDRFGYNNGIYALGYFYPILAVYDKSGWNLNPYTWIGDPVYAETSNYKVYIIANRSMVIAATGVRKRVDDLGKGLKGELWIAENVREFAFVASKEFKVSKTVWKNITIYSYYKPEKGLMGEAALEYAKRAIKVFSENIGFYPYPEFRAVEVDFGYGGMEYPMLIMIAGKLYEPERAFWLELVIAHETGHQWFYNIIGNDEYDEPWLDEGFTELVTILYFEWNYGYKRGLEVYNMYKSHYYRYLSRHVDYPLALSVGFFERKPYPYSYYYIVYRKGACVLFMLRRMLGDDLFFKCLRTYYERFKFRIATIDDFIKTVEEVSGQDLDWFFEHWVFGSGVPRYTIRSLRAYPTFQGYVLEVEIGQLDETPLYLKMRVPLLVKTSSGEFIKWVWVNGTASTVRVLLSDKPVSVRVDPYDYILGQDAKTVFYVKIMEETVTLPFIRGLTKSFLVQLGVLLTLLLVTSTLLILYRRKGGKVL
ncbi:MAG: hypothetical protein DRJ51_04540 [Thermoprotei archaeon]|nr:MAG: hypothetical protein DRJ51_04540 [Thermoprotei archaeon]